VTAAEAAAAAAAAAVARAAEDSKAWPRKCPKAHCVINKGLVPKKGGTRCVDCARVWHDLCAGHEGENMDTWSCCHIGTALAPAAAASAAPAAPAAAAAAAAPARRGIHAWLAQIQLGERAVE